MRKIYYIDDNGEIKFFDKDNNDIVGFPEVDLNDDPEILELFEHKLEELLRDLKDKNPDCKFIDVDEDEEEDEENGA